MYFVSFLLYNAAVLGGVRPRLARSRQRVVHDQPPVMPHQTVRWRQILVDARFSRSSSTIRGEEQVAT